MYIITQTSLFDNEEIEILGDLERLKLAIENMPDEKIVRRLRKIRKNGRDEWPVEAMWNTFIASYVGYDYTDLIVWLEKYDISPIIDIQNHWKDGEKTKQYRNTDLTYSYDGKVYWTDERGKEIKLSYAGYDKQTESLRYKFPPQIKDKRIFRIKIEEDRRIFTPIARDSKKWKREYKKRTSIERENGRLDRDYGFEKHTIRGKEKMEMFITMAFLVQLSMAKGKIEQNQKEKLSALVA